MPAKKTDAELELSVAELETLEASPGRPRRKKKATLKRKGKKQTIPRDGLGRFAPKPNAA